MSSTVRQGCLHATNVRRLLLSACLQCVVNFPRADTKTEGNLFDVTDTDTRLSAEIVVAAVNFPRVFRLLSDRAQFVR